MDRADGQPRHEGPHVAALAALGVPPAEVARVHRPIGLDIGSRAPAEIAVSTLAGLLADRNGRAGASWTADLRNAGRPATVEDPGRTRSQVPHTEGDPSWHR
ncbi:XdhC family protein [Klenkia terrae]|uniref:XdhC family protein n=1 Tax=Klenkia terrae TaxID=1052259 RepID=UPI003621CBC0